ncbi:metallophosphoesterase [uncultured Nocardioides sp.]|uniref:metallophosphoesterase family protein n=1 Tax=uncultured Nocardioides sp. TaxID=198441 RepID=UPI0025D3ECFB|nr:metallophosphoesterase [uncultured Nocardioides sp.]
MATAHPRAHRRPATRRRVLAAVGVVTLTVACAGTEPETTPDGSSSVTAAVGEEDAAASVRVVAVGDIACEPGEPVTPTQCQQAATARLTTSLDPDAVIALGDMQYETGSADGFHDSYSKSWGPLLPLTRPTPGNHEYNSTAAAGYFDYFGDPPPWYAWDAGAWRVYMVNSNCGDVDCDAQEEWLDAELTSNDHDCAALVMHYPRYSSGKHGSADFMSRFWEVAYSHHVDLALAGHDHDYERFAPMDADGQVRPGRGITSFVAGTGGKSLYERGEPVAGSEYFQNSAFGVLSLTLSPRDFSWSFLDTERSVLDEGSAACI